MPNKKFAIGIPTLNRADLLEPSLKKYEDDFPNTEIFVIDNGKQWPVFPPEALGTELIYIQNEQNKGVAGSWNQICQYAFRECDYAIILNDDVYWGKKEQEVIEFLESRPDKHLYTHHLDWSVFIIPKTTFEKVGAFDEVFFPAYCEDNDYVYRMKLMHMQAYKHPFLFPQIHRSSMTMEKDDSLSMAFIKNKKRYKEKWGGPPHMEKFTTPYNK